MSAQLNMWRKLKELNLQEVDAWIRTISPSKGLEIDFYGIYVTDVDLLEALNNWRNDLVKDIEKSKENHPSISEENFYH